MWLHVGGSTSNDSVEVRSKPCFRGGAIFEVEHFERGEVSEPEIYRRGIKVASKDKLSSG